MVYHNGSESNKIEKDQTKKCRWACINTNVCVGVCGRRMVMPDREVGIESPSTG